MDIKYFKGKNYYLSNFYEAPVVYSDILFRNSEAAFQSAKCINKDDMYKFKDLPPNEAKRLGRQIKLRPDWESIKDDVMYKVVYDKFNRNKDIRDKLFTTGYLEEGNNWHDNYWGVCNCYRCYGGKNKLGEILIKVREELKERF